METSLSGLDTFCTNFPVAITSITAPNGGFRIVTQAPLQIFLKGMPVVEHIKTFCANESTLCKRQFLQSSVRHCLLGTKLITQRQPLPGYFHLVHPDLLQIGSKLLYERIGHCLQSWIMTTCSTEVVRGSNFLSAAFKAVCFSCTEY